MDIWDKRRRNLKVLMAVKNHTASSVSRAAKMSINTVNKFIRGETKSLRWDTLETICAVLDVHNVAILDADNPFSESKNQLYKLVDEMTEDQAAAHLVTLAAIIGHRDKARN